MRDGAQTVGVSFLLADKVRIATALDDLGLDSIEAGFPGANPVDTAFFARPPALAHARLTAFGMTRRVGTAIAGDSTLQTVLAAGADAFCLVAKSSAYHVRVALGITGDENLEIVRESVAAAAATGRPVTLNCEHYFDGFKADRAYTLRVAQTAFEAGARWVTLCDTNGGTLPDEIERIVAETASVVPGSHLGIHTHDDTGHAVANTFAAVRAGCRQIQGTLNGIGERCGNANLTTIIPTLVLKAGIADRFECGATPDRLRHLRQVSLLLDEILGRSSNPQAPYVGDHAFATKCGIHASGLAKDRETYEHILPESVGNTQRVLTSNQAGRSNLLTTLKTLHIAVADDDPRLDQLLETVKQREVAGYAYDTAPASFELLVRRALTGEPRPMRIDSCQTVIDQRPGAEAPMAKVRVQITAGDGNALMDGYGAATDPVQAILEALCGAIEPAPGRLAGLSLEAMQIRTLSRSGPPAIRLLVEMSDAGSDERWSTIGVAPDVTGAALEALADALDYKLHREAMKRADDVSAVTDGRRMLRRAG